MSSYEMRALTNLIRARGKDDPYVVLLGSGLSLTSAVIQDAIGSDDWDAFCSNMEGLSADERYSLLKGPLDRLDLIKGYRCMAELVRAGHFNPILTAAIDSQLHDALVAAGLASDDLEMLVNGKDRVEQIVAALRRRSPAIKVLMLRGRLQARIIPITPNEVFEFDSQIADIMAEYLARDVIVVGSNPRDNDINRCIRGQGGSIWYVTPEPPLPDDYIYLAQRTRGTGGVISGEHAGFNRFFCTLAQALGLIEAPDGVQEVGFDGQSDRSLGYRRASIQAEIKHHEDILAEHSRNRQTLEKIVAREGVANVDLVLKLERLKEQEETIKMQLAVLVRDLLSLEVPKQE